MFTSQSRNILILLLLMGEIFEVIGLESQRSILWNRFEYLLHSGMSLLR